MGQESKKILLKIPGETCYLDEVRNFITGIAADAGFNEEDLHRIEAAVDEACANVMEHAYDQSEAIKPVTISLELTPSRLVISVIDYGKGFNPDILQSPDISKYISEKKNSGLGLFMIKALMDEIDYKSNPGKYNELVMIKYIHPR